ncbi:class I SAM-dependent methyltransferase [Longispora albida]|uniref:class I SAM-dependent methyltransferase n=1 Tax=Longispora albida TaxID=203523 RepID=UPI00036C606F|nr:methyltransferase domain-containing protein [Longispora albida]
MDDLGNQLTYWDTAGATKTFTHPVVPAWLDRLAPGARILDYGCGYGRVMAGLAGQGYTSVHGVDISPALIARGRTLHPGLDFAVLEHPPAVPAPPASFDAVLLLAVLTCVPDPGAQQALVAEVSRLLVPGGLLYVSDLLIAADERNRERYAAAPGDLPYGVFTTADGAVCRHHDPEALRALLSGNGFDIAAEHRLDVATMNGNRSPAIQFLARRRDGEKVG